MPDKHNGPERRRIHPWRWRLLVLWVIVFTLATSLALRQNRENINELKHTKANIQALQKTNCGLKRFLLTARAARVNDARRTKGLLRQADLRAARGYAKLVQPFTKEATGRCEIPKRLQIGG